MIRILKIVGICFLIGVSISNANACSCDTIPFNEAIENADEIFIGRIIKAERFEAEVFIDDINDYEEEKIIWGWKYEFEIKQKWKGSKKSKLILYNYGSSCDAYFDIYEREYLVYASECINCDYSIDEEFGAMLCSRTIENHYWDKESWFYEDIERLNKEFPVKIKLNKYQINWIWIAIISFLVLGIGFGIKQLLNHEKKV